MTNDESTLDREGEWEIRVTIYRNGRRVAICDTTGWDTYDAAAYWASEGLVTREVDFPVPKKRRPAPVATPSDEDGAS